MIRCRTGECRGTDRIAGSEYPWNVRLKKIVYLHGSTRGDIQAQPFESNAVEIGDTAECGEHDIRCQRFGAAQLNFHSMVQTESVGLSPADLRAFIESCGRIPHVVNLAADRE